MLPVPLDSMVPHRLTSDSMFLQRLCFLAPRWKLIVGMSLNVRMSGLLKVKLLPAWVKLIIRVVLD